MNVACTACGASLDPDDLPPGGGFSKCRYCGATVKIDASAAPPLGSGPRPAVEKPWGVRVEETAVGFRIVRRWFSPVFVILVFFCAIWDGFLWFWYSHLPGNSMGVLLAVFPVIHLAVGVGLTYFTIAGFANRTPIDVSRGSLSVRHRPLWWPGGRDLPASDLAQIFTEEHVYKNENGSNSDYRLVAIRKDGSRVKLLTTIPSREQALYMEQQIEGRLGIKDRSVAGEVQRD